MSPVPSRPNRPRLLAVLGAALLLALLGAACSGADSDDSASTTDDAGSATFEAAADRAEGEVGLSDSDVAAESPEDAGGSGAGSDSADGTEPLPPVDTTSTAATGERIIKEGTVTVEVDPGEFDTAFGQVISRAQALGGHVSGTSSSTDAEGLVSGQVTIRVPVRSFEDLLTVIGDAGTIVDRDVTSQDVTEEFTDLESRRRNLQAQERFYLGLLEEAQSVTDAIAVQQQLEGIQQQIEQITGRLNLLEDRTSFSTLTVRIRELGAEATLAAEADEGRSFADYLETAGDTLIATVGAIIVALTFSLPFLVLALIGWAIWRAVRSDRRSHQAPTGGPVAPPPSASAPLPPAPGHGGQGETVGVGSPGAPRGPGGDGPGGPTGTGS